MPIMIIAAFLFCLALAATFAFGVLTEQDTARAHGVLLFLAAVSAIAGFWLAVLA